MKKNVEENTKSWFTLLFIISGVHNQQDEADEIIQNMFPNENMQQYSRITDVLKAVARDENLPYEKKKILCVIGVIEEK